jgi:hypothetical protein
LITKNVEPQIAVTARTAVVAREEGRTPSPY